MLKKLFGGLLRGRNQSSQEELTFEQRRKAARRPCHFEVECRLGRSDFTAEVVDMSAGGIRIHVHEPVKLKPKSILHLTYLDSKDVVQTVECLTRWTRERDADGSMFAGVEFKDPKGLGRSWVKSKMQEIGFRPYNVREQRHDYRVNCRLKAQVNLGGTLVPCQVKNVGLGGLFIELSKPIRAGAEVEVKLLENSEFPAQSFGATVRHQQHPEPASPWGYGLAFKSISLDQANTIRDYIQKRQKEEWEELRKGAMDYSDYAELAALENSAEEEVDVEIPSLDSIMDETEETES
jgi:c-di-GMP-binding flagellar brake protein YcgR